MGNIVTCMARCVKCSDVYFHEMLWGKKKWERARTYTYIDDYIYMILFTYTYHIPTACITILRGDFTWLSTKLNWSKCLSLSKNDFPGNTLSKRCIPRLGLADRTWSARMPARSDRSLGSPEGRSIGRLVRRYLWYAQDAVVSTCWAYFCKQHSQNVLYQNVQCANTSYLVTVSVYVHKPECTNTCDYVPIFMWNRLYWSSQVGKCTSSLVALQGSINWSCSSDGNTSYSLGDFPSRETWLEVRKGNWDWTFTLSKTS